MGAPIILDPVASVEGSLVTFSWPNGIFPDWLTAQQGNVPGTAVLFDWSPSTVCYVDAIASDFRSCTLTAPGPSGGGRMIAFGVLPEGVEFIPLGSGSGGPALVAGQTAITFTKESDITVAAVPSYAGAPPGYALSFDACPGFMYRTRDAITGAAGAQVTIHLDRPWVGPTVSEFELVLGSPFGFA